MAAGVGGSLSASAKKKVAEANQNVSTHKMTSPTVTMQKSIELRGIAEKEAREAQSRQSASQHKEVLEHNAEMHAASLVSFERVIFALMNQNQGAAGGGVAGGPAVAGPPSASFEAGAGGPVVAAVAAAESFDAGAAAAESFDAGASEDSSGMEAPPPFLN